MINQRINIVQKGFEVDESYLNISKTNVTFSPEGGRAELITVRTDAIEYSVISVPSWCTIKKYPDYISITSSPNLGAERSDWFKIKSGTNEVKVDVVQFAEAKELIKDKRNRPQLRSFSSLGIQSGEIANYGLIYERGGRKVVGFRFSARTSLTSADDVLAGISTKNKTEIELGPNIKLFKRVYINLGAGYGYYDKVVNNDYANTLKLEKTGYSVATSGLMIRLSRVININGGVSFMDIDKEIYKPEITFGVSFNLKSKHKF